MNGIFGGGGGGGGGSGDAKKNTGSMWNLINSDLITTYCKDLGEFRSGLVRETQSLKNLAFTSPNPNSDNQIQSQSQSRARPSQGNEPTHKANNSPSNPDDGKGDDYSRRETPRHRKSAVDVIKVLKSSAEDNFDDGHSKFSKND